MELCFMGTASAAPTYKRGVSCTALKFNGEVWLFDCGEGSQMQLGKSTVKFGRITKIFITHLHGDHVFGLPGLLASISLAAGGGERTEPLEVYGPVGLAKLLRVTLGLSGCYMGFKYTTHELVPDPKQTKGVEMYHIHQSADTSLIRNEVQGRRITRDEDGVWTLLENAQYSVKAGMLMHGIPSYGYVVSEKPAPGKLDAAFLKEIGVPKGPQYAQLKQGLSITTPSGRVVTSEEAVGPPRPGLRLTVLGDTLNSAGMEGIAADSDVLIHETTLENSMETDCVKKGHSTPAMAGAFARKIRAKKLIITHFSQRYHPISEVTEKPGEDNVQTLLDETKAAFWSDNVIAAEDLMEIKLTRPER